MTIRTRTSAAIALTIALALEAVPTAFAAGTMTLHMVPHCTEASGCPEFTVVDGSHYTTGQLSAGDILDIDVLVRGTEHLEVRSVKSWISYDPKALEARSVELTSALPSPTPGEQTIDKSQGLVKIGGATSNGFSTADTRIARVTFRVLDTTANTELSFANYNDAGNGHALVNSGRNSSGLDNGALPPPPCIDAILGCRGTPTPLLSGEPSKLTVKLTPDTQAGILTAQAAEIPSSSSSAQATNTAMSSSASSVSSISSSMSTGMSSSASSLTGAGSTFGILQVQDVRVTTKDDVIFLGWQALKSSELAGYNVYYGTVSGRYIQRRSLPATSTSLVLRELQPGTTYYLAVRAVNGQGQESVFSQEVSVTVGKPETATSPMTKLPPEASEVKGNPIEKRGGTTINGETGTSNMIIWIVVGSAVIGTGFAFRRQLSL